MTTRTASLASRLTILAAMVLLGANDECSQTRPTAKPAEKPVALSPVPPNDVAIVLTGLKSEGKLMPRSAKSELYAQPQAEDCQGWATARGQRIMVESRGIYYGYSAGYFRDGKTKMFQMIGYMYAEMGFQIGDRLFESGGYAVLADPETLVILADAKTKDWQGVPDQDLREFPLAVKLDAALLVDEEKTGFDDRLKLKRPRHSIIQGDGHLSLSIGQNKLSLKLIE